MNKKIVIGTILVSFILLILSSTLYIQKSRELRKLDPLELESMQKEDIIQTIYERQAHANIPLYYVLPIFAFFGLLVGATIYHIMSSDLEKKEKAIEHNNNIILKLMTGEERNVVNTLVDEGGKVRQYELSHLPNLNKVKTHRIILKLEQKGIIEKQRLGKINNIVLNKELYEFLKK